MPARNRIKEYIQEAYYHIYNRGVEKRGIFLDAQDYAVFLSYLKTYLLPKNTNDLATVLLSEQTSVKEKENARKLLRLNNFSDSIRFHAYCLMPNHFHFLLWQAGEESMDQFMNSLGTRYTMYFNKKYKRVGPLFQGVYKAVRAVSEEQLVYLTKYIHKNPSFRRKDDLGAFPYSSCSMYYRGKSEPWLDEKTIRVMWKLTPRGYREFVEEQKDDDHMYYSLKEHIGDY